MIDPLAIAPGHGLPSPDLPPAPLFHSMNNGWIYYDQIDRAAAGSTVLAYYTRRYDHFSAATWQQRIRQGQIRLDGIPAAAETVLQAGQKLAYHRPPWQEPDAPLEFATVYEDADLMVINKPSGLPVLPGGGFLQHTLLGQLELRYGITAPDPIHRLGRGTTGLVLLARTPAARASLSQQLRDRQMQKTYRALVQGTSLPDRFTITTTIGKVPYPTLGYLHAATPTGRPAESRGRVLERRLDTSLVEVDILTGRPHQIRIHMAAAGHPLWGDPLYAVGGIPYPPAEATGQLTVPGDCGYYLHALALGFTHPSSQQTMALSCPAPAILQPDPS